MERFLQWISLKIKLHQKLRTLPHVREGDIWWASVGENVGQEINGKSSEFSRPVLIFKKLSHNFFYVIPLTSRLRHGSWYSIFSFNNRKMAACLHQARAIDYRRFWSKIGRINCDDFRTIKQEFIQLIK